MLTIVEGEIKDILLGDAVVEEGHTGDGIALNMYKTVTEQVELPPELLKKSCTGLAFDGQYFALDAPTAFANKMESNVAWLMPGWDDAHRLELALGAVRQTMDWYKNLAVTVSNVQQRYKFGKGYEEALKAAKVIEKRLMSFSHFCETRFAAAEVTVYDHFIANHGILHKITTDRLALEGPNTAKRVELTNDIKNLESFKTMLFMLFATDVLTTVVKKHSLFVQKVTAILPHELTRS
jgi:hypothetical protein